MPDNTSPKPQPSPPSAEPTARPAREEPPESLPVPAFPEPDLRILSPLAKRRTATVAPADPDLDTLWRTSGPHD